MSAADTLAAWGVLRAGDVVDIARAVGLDLAVAAALLEQESARTVGGAVLIGRNVWGSDKVATAGAYVMGAEVTEAAYHRYRLALASRTAGQQGVGPCQLTAVGFQDQADRLGGCWQPLPNMRVGFSTLAGYINRWGVGPAFRAYNGGAGTVTDPARYPSPAAHEYERKALAKLARWRDRLGSTTTIPAAPAATTPEDDMLPDERAALIEVRDALRAAGFGKGRLPGRALDPARNAPDDAFGWLLTGAGRADDAARGVAALAGKLDDVAAPAPVAIDYAQLARAIVAELSGKAA